MLTFLQLLHTSGTSIIYKKTYIEEVKWEGMVASLLLANMTTEWELLTYFHKKFYISEVP